MGLSRRQFLYGTTLLAAAGCTSRVSGDARPNPVDLSRVRAAPAVPDTVEVTIVAFEPYTVQTSDGLSGPVPDVARKLLTDIGVAEVKFTVVSDEQKLLTMAAAGSLQMAGGMTIRPDLCDNGALQFSVPDYVSGTAFAVKAGNPKGLKTFADVVATGAKVAVWTGLPWEEDAVKAGVPNENIVRLNGLDPLFDAVRGGQADCFPFDDVSLRQLLKDQGEGLEATPPFMPDARPPLVGAYLFALDSLVFEQFNEALKELHESGEWLRMAEPFGFTEEHEPPADLTTEKACGN